MLESILLGGAINRSPTADVKLLSLRSANKEPQVDQANRDNVVGTLNTQNYVSENWYDGANYPLNLFNRPIPDLDPTADCTFEFVWFLDWMSGIKNIIVFDRKDSSSSSMWSMGSTFYISQRGVSTPTQPWPAKLNARYHGALVQDGDDVHFFRDGVWIHTFENARIFSYNNGYELTMGNALGRSGTLVKAIRVYQGAKYRKDEVFTPVYDFTVENS